MLVGGFNHVEKPSLFGFSSTALRIRGVINVFQLRHKRIAGTRIKMAATSCTAIRRMVLFFSWLVNVRSPLFDIVCCTQRRRKGRRLSFSSSLFSLSLSFSTKAMVVICLASKKRTQNEKHAQRHQHHQQRHVSRSKENADGQPLSPLHLKWWYRLSDRC